jgi:hypothetical protein
MTKQEAHTLRYWEDPAYRVRDVRANYCTRCEQEGHSIESHFDRAQFDCAAVGELDGLDLLRSLMR